MKTIRLVKYLFSVIGIAMLIGALLLYRNTSAFLADAARAQGTVIDLVLSRSSDSSTYHPVVRFVTADGQTIEFRSGSGSSPPSYSRGEKVEVLYDAAQPRRARLDGFFSLWGGAVIFGGLGTVFLLVGGGIIAAGVWKRRRVGHLRETGMPIETDFQSVRLNTAFTVNGRSPYRVLTQWQNPATSKVYVFESDNLWFDPSDYIDERKIRVFIERGDPGNYYVDLSFLPKLAT